MHGNENSISLYNIHSFPSAYWARRLGQPAAAPPCDYLTSAAVFSAQINLLLVSAGSRELPPCVTHQMASSSGR